MIRSLNTDDFGLTMLGLVQTSFRLVRNVDACVHVVVHHGAVKGDGPFRGVVAHDRDGASLRHLELLASLGKSHRILVVLVPRPAEFGAIAFDPHGRSVLSAPHCVLEHLRHGERHL